MKIIRKTRVIDCQGSHRGGCCIDLSLPVQGNFGIAVLVNYCDDNQLLCGFINIKMNGVWKNRAERCPHLLVFYLIMVRIFLQAANAFLYIISKTLFKALLLFVVPILGIAHVQFNRVIIG